MTYLENLCPWADGKTKGYTWQLQTVQDTATGLWTYTDAGGNGTVTVAPQNLLTVGSYVAVLESDSIPSMGLRFALGDNDTRKIKELERTETRLVTQVNRDYESPICLWLMDGVSVTPRRAGLFTLDGWQALQKLALDIPYYRDYPLFKQ
ncbi:hypothetical protein KIH79_06670 [Bifidobacterium sp. 82T10]|uniref:Uncharacterized protein n=1 Tax=Bifidobacterium miconis TaxID=2834435 RepID=A0ABS6WF15_9BIFI|nr:hypothetical protein [Bifidobacterium miconis]MBW3092633.1 hypothetical protein [Bifidobacterium miconis]